MNYKIKQSDTTKCFILLITKLFIFKYIYNKKTFYFSCLRQMREKGVMTGTCDLPNYFLAFDTIISINS